MSTQILYQDFVSFAAMSGVFSADVALSVQSKEPECRLTQHVGERRRGGDILLCLLLCHTGNTCK